MKALSYTFWVVVIAVAIGCSQQKTAAPDQSSQSPTAIASGYLLETEPAGAKGVAETGEEAENDEEVVVVGRIGGSVDPWVQGTAAFDIVDLKLVPCNEREGDDCPTPWDYCCDLNELPTSTLTVKLVDEAGNAVKTDARELLGVKELQTVVVRGKVKKDASSLVVLARGVHVKE